MLATSVFPLFGRLFPSKILPGDFAFRSARLDLFGDESKNTLSFNADAGIYGTYILANPQILKEGDLVPDADAKGPYSLYVDDRDPNSAIVILTFFQDEWYGTFDLVYNRENTLKKHESALVFLESAQSDLNDSNFVAFYDGLWSACELLVESILLLHNLLKLEAGPKTIPRLFEEYCRNANLLYHKDYEKIRTARDNALCGRSPGDGVNIEKNAGKYMARMVEFSKHVEGFLKGCPVPAGVGGLVKMKQADAADTLQKI